MQFDQESCLSNLNIKMEINKGRTVIQVSDFVTSLTQKIYQKL